MSFLITELEQHGRSKSAKLAKEIVQKSINELYRFKKHTRLLQSSPRRVIFCICNGRVYKE